MYLSAKSSKARKNTSPPASMCYTLILQRVVKEIHTYILKDTGLWVKPAGTTFFRLAQLPYLTMRACCELSFSLWIQLVKISLFLSNYHFLPSCLPALCAGYVSTRLINVDKPCLHKDPSLVAVAGHFHCLECSKPSELSRTQPDGNSVQMSLAGVALDLLCTLLSAFSHVDSLTIACSCHRKYMHGP